VDCPGHGDRADEGTEGEDRFAFSGLAVGVVQVWMTIILLK
jgi:hypothetical protein